MNNPGPVLPAVVTALLAIGASAAGLALAPVPQQAAPTSQAGAPAPARDAAPAQAAPALAAPPALSDPAAAKPLFRIILNDGTALVSYGEFTRVGDRVVFSMPLDSPRGDRLQLVNLPASVVNWESTEQYTIAARYAQYTATRAEADFSVLTGVVANALNEIALAKTPERKLQIAEQTRRVVSAWPMEHYGFRSADVEEMLSLLDGTISDLRGATGIKRFDFSMVATIEPPSMPLLPDPTASQAIDQVILAARLSDVPAERITLLRSALTTLEQRKRGLPAAWVRQTRTTVQKLIEAELEVERQYAELSKTTVSKAVSAAAKGDVRSVEQAAATLQARDRALGERRPSQVASLLELLQDRLDAARRLRLMRDQWARKAPLIRAYRGAVAGPIDRLGRLRRSLDDVKALAGPDVDALPDLAHRFEQVARQLAAITPPPDMEAAHATLRSSAELGQQAMRTRERAAAKADVAAAWDASAAAAGSIMMLAQARQQIDDLSRPPELQ
jgi:hypothetical protein